MWGWNIDEIIKSINSETNNKPPVNDGPTAEFYKHFSNELAPFQMVFQSLWLTGESLKPWVLLIGQESYLPYIKGDKEGITKL